jgi:hypothetical protein
VNWEEFEQLYTTLMREDAVAQKAGSRLDRPIYRTPDFDALAAEIGYVPNAGIDRLEKRLDELAKMISTLDEKVDRLLAQK